MTGDDVNDDVTGSGGDRKLGLPPRVVDVLRQMSPYADRLKWTVSEDSSTVSLALVWDLRSAAAASSWRRCRWLRPVERTPAADSDDIGLLQRLKRRLDRLPEAPRPDHISCNAIASGDEAAPVRGRGLLRRCVTSLTALRLWRTRHSHSSPSLSSERLHTSTVKQQQQQQQYRQRQQTVGHDDLFYRSRFTSVQVSNEYRTALEYFFSEIVTDNLS